MADPGGTARGQFKYDHNTDSLQIITSGDIELSGGNVGIGTSTPAYRLDVAGNGANTARLGTGASDKLVVGGGAGKIDAGTVDPVYTINGIRYATYVPGIAGGVKEETTDVLALRCVALLCRRSIEFGHQAEGSDLWLFSKTTNLRETFDRLGVVLTPSFEGDVWYEKDAASLRLTIFARLVGKRPVEPEVTYRLTAPRFDHANWSNYHEGGDYPGFVINDASIVAPN